MSPWIPPRAVELAGAALSRLPPLTRRRGPWTESDQSTVWLHAASLGETKGLVRLVRALDGIPLTLTSTTASGLARLKREAPGAFACLLPPEERSSLERFVAARGVVAAVFLEAEVWPVTLSVLSAANVPVALAALRSSPRSLRRWRALGRIIPGWTDSVTIAWTDRPGAVEAWRALGIAEVRAGAPLKWAGAATVVPRPEPGLVAAVSPHLRDLPALARLVRERPGRSWLWFPRRPCASLLFEAWARLLGLRPTSAQPRAGEVRVVHALGLVAEAMPRCEEVWVAPGHDREEPIRLGASRLVGEAGPDIPSPEAGSRALAELVAWILECRPGEKAVASRSSGMPT